MSIIAILAIQVLSRETLPKINVNISEVLASNDKQRAISIGFSMYKEIYKENYDEYQKDWCLKFEACMRKAIRELNKKTAIFKTVQCLISYEAQGEYRIGNPSTIEWTKISIDQFVIDACYRTTGDVEMFSFTFNYQ